MKVAMTFDNGEFIDCVMDCWPDGFPDLLHTQDSEGKNCLHQLFAVPNLRPTPGAARDKNAPTLPDVRFLAKNRGPVFVSKAKPETLTAKDKDGNTPIHYAMDYWQCSGRNEKYVDMVRQMVLKADTVMKTQR